MAAEEWRTAEHVLRYLARRAPTRTASEGNAALPEHVPRETRRLLGLGTGDGRLLALLHGDRRDALG